MGRTRSGGGAGRDGPHENRGGDHRAPESRNCRRRGGLTAGSGKETHGTGGKGTDRRDQRSEEATTVCGDEPSLAPFRNYGAEGLVAGGLKLGSSERKPIVRTENGTVIVHTVKARRVSYNNPIRAN